MYCRHLRRAEVTGRLEVQGVSLLSLLALTCNRVRLAGWHGAYELTRSEGGYPAFAIAMNFGQPLLIAMYRRGRRESFCGRVFFSLRTSSFPARRQSSSALSRVGNDQGFMTKTVQAPLFSKEGKDSVKCRLALSSACTPRYLSFRKNPGLTGVIVLVVKDIISGLLSP